MTCAQGVILSARQPERGLGGKELDYGRAVRLKGLWNGSFHLNLQIQTDSDTDFVLRGNTNETSDRSFALLGRLANNLGPKLILVNGFYTIG